MQEKLKQSVLLSWLIAVLVFFISLIRVYDIALDKIEPYSAFSPFIPWVVVPAYIFCFIRSRKGSLRAQLVLLNFLFFFIYLSFLNIIGGIYTQTSGPAFDVRIFIHSLLNIVLLILTLYMLRGMVRVIDTGSIKERFNKRPPRELTALFFFLAAIVIAANFWMEFTYLFMSHKLDCFTCIAGSAFLFPFYLFFLYIAVAVLLISNRRLGYVLAPGLLLFCGIGGFMILNSLGYHAWKAIEARGLDVSLKYSNVLVTLQMFDEPLAILPPIAAIVLIYLFLRSLMLKQELEKAN